MDQNVKLAKRGDKEAFSRLIRENQTSLYRVSRAILMSDQDCADAIQEATIKAYKSITKIRNDQFFKTWLIRIVINECRNLLRSKQSLVALDEAVNQADMRGTENQNQNIEVREAVRGLDENLRVVIALYYYEDMPVKEIAKVLRLPEGTVKSRLARGRSQLHKALKITEG